jgi:hypothetical protein
MLNRRLLTSMLCVMLIAPLWAQPGDPGDPGDPVPLGGIEILVLVGVLLGIGKLWVSKRKTKKVDAPKKMDAPLNERVGARCKTL